MTGNKPIEKEVSRNERVGQRIAKRAIREMLGNANHRADITEYALTYVENYSQGLYARKHVNIYCRRLKGALKKLA